MNAKNSKTILIIVTIAIISLISLRSLSMMNDTQLTNNSGYSPHEHSQREMLHYLNYVGIATRMYMDDYDGHMPIYQSGSQFWQAIRSYLEEDYELSDLFSINCKQSCIAVNLSLSGLKAESLFDASPILLYEQENNLSEKTPTLSYFLTSKHQPSRIIPYQYIKENLTKTIKQVQK
jgi:hypothetical protein